MVTHDRLRELLSYDPDTGLFTWLTDRTPSVRAGSIAGTVQSHGYVHIKIDERVYKGHRLAWFYVHGVWPADCLDHRNMQKADNRLSNLREATRSQNNMNREVPAHSSSGVTGVNWNCAARKWSARINIDGRRTNLGFFGNIEDAISARTVAVSQHYGEFARVGG